MTVSWFTFDRSDWSRYQLRTRPSVWGLKFVGIFDRTGSYFNCNTKKELIMFVFLLLVASSNLVWHGADAASSNWPSECDKTKFYSDRFLSSQIVASANWMDHTVHRMATVVSLPVMTAWSVLVLISATQWNNAAVRRNTSWHLFESTESLL